MISEAEVEVLVDQNCNGMLSVYWIYLGFVSHVPFLLF